MAHVYDADLASRRFDARVGRLAARQFGVISRSQLMSIGATRNAIIHRLRTGRWMRVSPHVFRLAGAPPSFEQSVMAACLARNGAASHTTAAALWSVPTFPKRGLELTAPRNKRDLKAPGKIHTAGIVKGDVTRIGPIPVTTPNRTLLDLARHPNIEEALDDMLARELTTIPRLQRYLDDQRGRGGVGILRTLLDERRLGVPRSVFETRVFKVLKRAGLPLPVPQHKIFDGAKLVAVCDFAYPEQRIAIEADSRRWHTGTTRWEADLVRRNEVTGLGWAMLHTTWDEINNRPERFLATVRNALRRYAGAAAL